MLRLSEAGKSLREFLRKLLELIKTCFAPSFRADQLINTRDTPLT